MKNKEKEYDRRSFLKASAAVTGLAAAGVQSAKGQINPPGMAGQDERILPYGVPSRYEKTKRIGFPGAYTPHQDLVGVITPNPLHYVVSHGMWAPDIDPQEHKLLIHGMVDRPLVFTLDELKRLPYVSRTHFLMCAGSSYVTLDKRLEAKTVQETHGWTSCAEWTGVPLSVVLKKTGVKEGASWVVAEDTTKAMTVSIPLEKIMDDALLAYGQNGEALRPHNGYPLRLLVPGFEGIRSCKWLRRIKIVDEPYMTKWEASVYTNLYPEGKARWFQMQLEPNSVITHPSGGQQLPGEGFYNVSGLAWSGGGSVSKVEVSIDGGRHWKAAQLQQPVQRMAHTRFHFPWNWDGKEAVIQSRCTDENGDIQPTLAEINQIWGVSTDFWLSRNRGEHRIQHLNAVQPWKIMRDGRVTNVLWEA